MEAVLAALYLEHGLDELAGPVIEAFEPRIEEALTESVDQKTTLQEELAKRGQRVEYVTLSRPTARRTTAPSRAPRSSTASRSGPAAAGRRRTPSRRPRAWRSTGSGCRTLARTACGVRRGAR